MRSASPLLYAFAVSNATIPRSSARSTMRRDSFSGVRAPKFIVPTIREIGPSPLRAYGSFAIATSLRDERDFPIAPSIARANRTGERAAHGVGDTQELPHVEVL